MFFILLTIIGGSVISTSSGLKYVRFYILLKVSFNEIYKLVKPIIYKKFKMQEVQKAHIELESRKITGPAVFIP